MVVHGGKGGDEKAPELAKRKKLNRFSGEGHDAVTSSLPATSLPDRSDLRRGAAAAKLRYSTAAVGSRSAGVSLWVGARLSDPVQLHRQPVHGLQNLRDPELGRLVRLRLSARGDGVLGRRRRRGQAMTVPSIVVNVDVPELKPAIEFYVAAVGAKVARLLDDDVAELRYGSSLLCLLMKPSGSAATPTGHRRELARHWTPVHVDFVVDDIDAAVTRAVEAGAKRESECI